MVVRIGISISFLLNFTTIKKESKSLGLLAGDSLVMAVATFKKSERAECVHSSQSDINLVFRFRINKVSC